MSVLVIMPLPRSDGEDIAFMPLQALALDDDGAFAFEAEIEGGAVMAMGQSFLRRWITTGLARRWSAKLARRRPGWPT